MEKASIGRRLATAALCACLVAMGIPAAALAQDGSGNGLETQMEVVFDGGDGSGTAMQTAIDAALSKLPAGKSKGDVSDIVVTGDATAITGGDWTTLKECYKDGGEWTSLSRLDLSGMSGLKEVSGTDGGNAAFGKLVRVELPDTLGSIGDFAFSGCAKLDFDNYGLPDSLSSIGEGAFSGCTGLVLQGLPKDVETIGASAFSGCTGLRLEFLPEGVKSVGDRTFQGCTSLALHSLYEGVDFIGESAFEGCTSLVLGRLPDSIKAIGESAFSGCEKLDFSEIPANTSIVGPKTFYGCKNLERMSFPSGLKFVGESAFEGCTGLKELSFRSEGDPPQLDTNAFKDVAQGGTVYCPDAKTYEYEDSFVANGPSGWRYESFYALEVTFDGDVTMEKAIDAALAKAGKSELGVKDIVVTGDATKITGGDWGKLKRCYLRDSTWANLSGLDLSGMRELTEVSDLDLSPDSSYARLIRLKLPDGLETIGSCAFQNCRNLAIDELPSSLEAVGKNAFDNCYKLALDELPSDLASIGTRAFRNCSSLALEGLPVGIEDVPDWAFEGCSSLALAKLPANLSSIGKSAFAGCEKLAVSALPAKVSSIGSYAFSNCKGLKAMALPPALQSVGNNAFERCSNLAELEFHGPAPVLGTDVFSGVAVSGELYALEGAGYVKGEFGGGDLAGWDFIFMARRTLADEVTGVRITGVLSPDAALLVKEGGLHPAGECDACDAMRGREAAGKVLGSTACRWPRGACGTASRRPSRWAPPTTAGRSPCCTALAACWRRRLPRWPAALRRARSQACLPSPWSRPRASRPRDPALRLSPRPATASGRPRGSRSRSRWRRLQPSPSFSPSVAGAPAVRAWGRGSPPRAAAPCVGAPSRSPVPVRYSLMSS